MNILRVFALLSGLLLTACATLSPDYEEPTVTLNSFRALPSEGMAPSFEIGLRILNPNAQALDLQGIVYTISLNGYELVKGVGKDFPAIEGYSESDVKLTASANLLAGMRLVHNMMQSHDGTFDYEFKAKLDLGGLYPSIKIRETGNINLDGSTGPQ